MHTIKAEFRAWNPAERRMKTVPVGGFITGETVTIRRWSDGQIVVRDGVTIRHENGETFVISPETAQSLTQG